MIRNKKIIEISESLNLDLMKRDSLFIKAFNDDWKCTTVKLTLEQAATLRNGISRWMAENRREILKNREKNATIK